MVSTSQLTRSTGLTDAPQIAEFRVLRGFGDLCDAFSSSARAASESGPERLGLDRRPEAAAFEPPPAVTIMLAAINVVSFAAMILTVVIVFASYPDGGNAGRSLVVG
jgi:hypothetical protein